VTGNGSAKQHQQQTTVMRTATTEQPEQPEQPEQHRTAKTKNHHEKQCTVNKEHLT
jgi:hypothetical protein